MGRSISLRWRQTVRCDPGAAKQLVRHTENSTVSPAVCPKSPKPTAKQMAAVTLLSGGERYTQSWKRGVSRAVLDNLCAKGVLECRKGSNALWTCMGTSLCRTSRWR